MRVFLCVFALLTCTATLHAQDVVVDTVQTEEEYQYIDNEDNEDDTAGQDSSSNDKPITIHNLISPEELPATKDNAGGSLTVREFDDKKWKNVIGTETFEEKPEKPKKKEDNSSYNLPQIPWGGDGLRIVAYIIVIALIVGVIYLFTKDMQFKVKVKAVTLPADDLTAAVENIEHIEIATPLQKALSDSNFKLATRLYFLDLLKRLHEARFIVWKKDKTNRDYLMELYTKEFHYQEIHKLTLAYELVWYGEHALSNEAYQRLFADFESLFQKINTPVAA